MTKGFVIHESNEFFPIKIVSKMFDGFDQGQCLQLGRRVPLLSTPGLSVEVCLFVFCFCLFVH